MPSPEYIRRLQEAIRATHGAESRHVGTARVKETFEGQVSFDGEVETFELIGHPKAALCYAWAWDDNGTLRSTCVLGVPPVDSPGTAATIAILAKAKKEMDKEM
jgi:hypothetical protein